MERFRLSPDIPQTLEDFIAGNLLVNKAYKMAEQAHREQKRDDGTPYIEHCIAVARIGYEEWGITDPEKISALLLHDTVEDAGVTQADLRRDFGANVESWVDSLTKFEKEKETYKKIVERNLIDPNVGMFKLADVLHNSRTISTAREDKRVRNARKTLNVYAPLAESLGMWMVKTELEDLCLEYAYPEIYDRYSKLFNNDERTQEPFIRGMQSKLENIIEKANVSAYVAIRKNSLIRLKDKKQAFSDINDVVSFRMIVTGGSDDEKRDNCNKLVGRIRKEFGYQEDQNRFDDFYDDTKKNNLYSAIQITLDTEFGAIEIAVTSDEKEDYNNWGVLSLIRKSGTALQDYALKIVITPTGQAKFLPPEANGLDLAYLIDKKMAAQAVSITINGEVFPLSTDIPNGADVKINRGPDRIAPDHEIVAMSSPSTKKKAEKQFKEQKRHDVEKKGKDIVQKVIAEAGLIELHDLARLNEHADKLVDLLNFTGSKKSEGLLYRQVKYNVITENELRDYLIKYKITKKDLGLTTILVDGDNKEDILSFIGKEIGRRKGDIRWTEGGSYDGLTFSQRFVVTNLTKDTEDEIRRILSFYPNVKNVIVV